MGRWDLAQLLQDVFQSLWHIKPAQLHPDLSQIWKQVRWVLHGAAFIGAIQRVWLGAVSSAGDDLQGSLLLLQQVTPLLGHRLPAAAGELTTSPSSIWMPLVMDAFRLERYKRASVSHAKDNYTLTATSSIVGIVKHSQLSTS